MINLKPNTRIRFIAPSWAKPRLKNGLPNPDFKEELPDFDVIEGYFTKNQIIIANQKGYNTYFFPNQSKEKITGEFKYLNGRDINDFQWVFADYDSKDQNYPSIGAFVEEVKNFEIPPTMINLTGNGAHVYWKINDLDRETLVETQFRLINRFKTDQSVWTVLQPMRLPGTLNTKEYGNFKVADLVEYNDNEYSVKELWQHLEPITEIQQEKLQRHLNRLDGKLQLSLTTDHKSDEIPEKFKELIKYDLVSRELWEKPSLTKNSDGRPDRSIADFLLANRLRGVDFSADEVYTVIKNTDKSLEHSSPERYAELTVEKVFSNPPQEKVKLPEKLDRIISKIYGPLR